MMHACLEETGWVGVATITRSVWLYVYGNVIGVGSNVPLLSCSCHAKKRQKCVLIEARPSR